MGILYAYVLYIAIGGLLKKQCGSHSYRAS